MSNIFEKVERQENETEFSKSVVLLLKDYFSQCRNHLLVPKAVYHRVEHGGHNGVEKREQFVNTWRMGRFGS